MPPKSTNAVTEASSRPTTQLTSVWLSKEGTKAVMALLTLPTMELAWDILPMPKQAMAATAQKVQASHFHFLPRPLTM